MNPRNGMLDIEEFRFLLERGGFTFEQGEFENLTKSYFRTKDRISLEEFKLFSTGKCVKLETSKPTKVYQLEEEE
jgi:hypothetical protein